MTRGGAAAIIVSLGGIPHTEGTDQTDVLVIGQGPGAKVQTAESYVAAGQTIEMLNEATFLRYLSGRTFEGEGRERPTTNADLQGARRAAEAAKVAPPKKVGRLTAAETGTVAIVELRCQACGRTWQRDSQRGRLPLVCPECRMAG